MKLIDLFEKAEKTLPIPATQDNIQKAKDFVLQKWKERSKEFDEPAPEDLSGASIFASLFAKAIFGGKIVGNAGHQFVSYGDRFIDLLDDCEGVNKMSNPFEVRKGWNTKDHRESVDSCKPRVEQWVEEFTTGLQQ